MSKFTLGNKLRDRVTGFEGIAVTRVEYLNGCVQYCLQPTCTDGTLPKAEYLDEHQLDVVDGEHVAVESAGTGGPSRYQPPSSYCG